MPNGSFDEISISTLPLSRLRARGCLGRGCERLDGRAQTSAMDEGRAPEAIIEHDPGLFEEVAAQDPAIGVVVA